MAGHPGRRLTLRLHLGRAAEDPEAQLLRAHLVLEEGRRQNCKISRKIYEPIFKALPQFSNDFNHRDLHDFNRGDRKKQEWKAQYRPTPKTG